jgi:hypothetical protein
MTHEAGAAEDGANVRPRPALRGLDEAIVELWRRGIRVQSEIGRCVGLDQRSVSRRIARMVRKGAWPFTDRPARGRSQVPVAASFVVAPVRPLEPLRDQPMGDW